MVRPRVAILGGGPVGLDAALAAVDAGFPFTVYEAASRVAAHVTDWGHVRLFTPWSMSVSPRMRRHLGDDGGGPSVDPEACPTGRELVEGVLDPVSRLPPLAANLRVGARVVRVGRKGLLKQESIGGGERRRRPFRILVEEGGERRVAEADVVLDCTGTWGHPNSVGDGGIPAPGEELLGDRLVRRIPDLANEADGWAGRTTLLVGAGHSAQTAVGALAALAEAHPGTRVVWVLRRSAPDWAIDDEDPLPARLALSRRARDLARRGAPGMEVRAGVAVEGFTERKGEIEVTLRREDDAKEAVVVDRVLGLTGSVGDHGIYRQLQVHECYATSGPMKLAAKLLGETSTDCLDQSSHGVDALRNPEPGFFILGSKSYGRNNTFLLRTGWQQVDEVFAALCVPSSVLRVERE